MKGYRKKMTNQKQPQPQQMQPFDALGVLDRAAGLAPLSRADHVAVQQAVQVIAQALQAAQAPEAEAPAEAAVEKKPTSRGPRGKKENPESS